jgi:hypothetical protein
MEKDDIFKKLRDFLETEDGKKSIKEFHEKMDRYFEIIEQK